MGKTGECECFDGYWGKACRRAQCPNDCSGHGTCEYMKELRTDVGDQFKWTGQAPTSDQFYHTFAGLWDYDRQMACLCDAKWTDVDCSRRMCPKGNYALYSDADQIDEVQTVNLAAQIDADSKFALIFRSTLGEEFTTRQLTTGVNGGATGSNPAAIQNALKTLPNRVIEDVTVTQGTDGDGTDGYSFTVTFSGACTSGNQYSLNVIEHYCPTGCMPQMDTSAAGKTMVGNTDTTGNQFAISSVASIGGGAGVAGIDVNMECSGRGVCDYESGICECFSGYTDESCSTQTALI